MNKIIELLTESRKFLMLTIGALLVFCSSALFVFICEDHIFIELDVLKLAIILIGITLPIVLVYALAIYFKVYNVYKDDDINIITLACILTSMVMTSCLIYVSIIFHLIYEWSTFDSIKYVYAVAAGSLVACYIYYLIKNHKWHKDL